MKLISLISAITLTGRSERTLWRWISDGTILRATDDAASPKTMISLESIQSYIAIPLKPDDLVLIEKADAGNVEAQNDLALLFLSLGKPENAIYWLELAAKQEYADAMHWLGRCYTDGTGVNQNENIGIMWLSKAAAHGHVISQVQMHAMLDKFTSKT